MVLQPLWQWLWPEGSSLFQEVQTGGLPERVTLKQRRAGQFNLTYSGNLGPKLGILAGILQEVHKL